MRILYDHQIFSSSRFGGISRYFCELFREFSDSGSAQWQASAFFTNNEYLQALSSRPHFLPDWKFRGKNRILEAVNKLATLRALAARDYDLFHSTYSKPYSRFLLGKRPYVITVHDMTHEKYPDKLPSARREAAEEKRSITSADAIIVPSEATRSDLIGFYPEAAPKIRVIYHGYRLPTGIDGGIFRDLGDYCIYTGTRLCHKDFPTAIQAFARLPEHFRLLCIGGGAFTAEENRMFATLGIAGRVRWKSCGEEELFSAYAGAKCLLFPSRAEGFGLPIIEAQSVGCVPILANTPCFREIGADGALYFPVGNAAQCAALVRELTAPSSETLRTELAEKMRRNLQRFQWKECARKHLKVYRALLDGSFDAESN
ncbi:MAG: glycosyltransferase family 1 protein [Victivallaceae bacterium]|nr:glycosyltransferase family 1 protein [Victivallaceae bacterium]